jgi:hypothetical protein
MTDSSTNSRIVGFIMEYKQKSSWSSKMNTLHVPLRKSTEGIVRGKGREVEGDDNE